MKRALVLNAGSSTLKWSVLEVAGDAPAREAGWGDPLVPLDRRAPLAPLAAGTVEWRDPSSEDRAALIEAALRSALAGRPVEAAGHRVVHGGADFHGPVRITPEVRQALAALAELDPLHTAAALVGIDAVAAAAPELPQVAAFDTSFHRTLPEEAAIYPLPWEWTRRFGLRRYGFHGLSVSYACRRVAQMIGGGPARLLVCHLGSGCSLTAVAGGRSVDTTMGFTPLEGVMMASRSGSVDPGLLLHLQRRCGLDLDALEDGLQQRSGLAGVSGAGPDLRQVLAAAAAGSRRAALAYDLFVHSLVRHAGAMIAVLGGLDALVLTGGIGERSPRLRADFLGRLGFAGVRLDPAANQGAGGEGAGEEAGGEGASSKGAGGDREISPAGAPVRVFVITAREDLAVLSDLIDVLAPRGA